MVNGRESLNAPIYLCDRCGGDCRRASDEPKDANLEHRVNSLHGQFEYCGAYGSIYDFCVWQADLCESCTLEFREFVNAGKGSGMREVDDVLDAHREFARENKLLDGEGGVIGCCNLDIFEDQEIRKRFKAFLFDRYKLVAKED